MIKYEDTSIIYCTIRTSQNMIAHQRFLTDQNYVSSYFEKADIYVLHFEGHGSLLEKT